MQSKILGVRRVSAAFILTAMCAACSPPPTMSTTTVESDVAAIRALEETFRTGVAAKNLDALMSVYKPDETLFVYDVVPPREYVGVKAYRDDFAMFLGMCDGPIDFRIENLAIDVDKDMAWSHSIQRSVCKASAHAPKWAHKGAKLDMTFRLTDVYRRIGGQWKVVHEHVSWPVDPDTLKADITAKP